MQPGDCPSPGSAALQTAARSLQLLLEGMHRIWGAEPTKRLLAAAADAGGSTGMGKDPGPAAIRDAAHAATTACCAVLRLPAAEELEAAQSAACGLLCRLLAQAPETDVRSLAGGQGAAAALLVLASGVPLASVSALQPSGEAAGGGSGEAASGAGVAEPSTGAALQPVGPGTMRHYAASASLRRAAETALHALVGQGEEGSGVSAGGADRGQAAGAQQAAVLALENNGLAPPAALSLFHAARSHPAIRACTDARVFGVDLGAIRDPQLVADAQSRVAAAADGREAPHGEMEGDDSGKKDKGKAKGKEKGKKGGKDAKKKSAKKGGKEVDNSDDAPSD